MCVQEMYVEGSLPMCIRVMVQVQREKANLNQETRHIYLRGAAKLRPDLAKKVAIAIDGPAGAGKSTIAKNVAKALGYVYIDTGAMYRALAYYCDQNKVDWGKERAVISVLDKIDIKIKVKDDSQYIYLNGQDVSTLIRSQEMATGASIVATYEQVREQLVSLQRKLARETSVVMDGRDIGTHVLTHADLKVFLTASVIERANRRVKELEENGCRSSLEEIKKEIINRDHSDSTREFSPLRKATDAVEIDTTGKSINEVTKMILDLMND